MRSTKLAVAAALITITAPAASQTAQRERIPLVSGNASVGVAQVYGGTYVVTQACSTYGTVTVRYRDPNGVMVTLLSKTSADTGGGTQVTLGFDAVIDAVVSGTAGCNVQAARVPS